MGCLLSTLRACLPCLFGRRRGDADVRRSTEMIPLEVVQPPAPPPGDAAPVSAGTSGGLPPPGAAKAADPTPHRPRPRPRPRPRSGAEMMAALPPEIVLRIFRMLDDRSLLRAYRAYGYWADVCRLDSGLLRRIDQQKLRESPRRQERMDIYNLRVAGPRITGGFCGYAYLRDRQN